MPIFKTDPKLMKVMADGWFGGSEWLIATTESADNEISTELVQVMASEHPKFRHISSIVTESNLNVVI